jgi:alanyl-tRNA synthetase
VAAGVRRIEAVAGTAALEAVARKEAALREAAEILKITPLEVPRRLQKLLEEQKALEKQLEALEAKLARSRAEELVASARQVNGVAVIAARVDGLDAEGLRSVADTLRDRLGSGVVCVGSVTDGKVSVIAAVTKDLTERFQAGRIIQAVAQAVGGRGGGRPDLAQGGGTEPDKLDGALSLVYDLVARVPA